VFTTSGTYPWSFVTQIFNNGQPYEHIPSQMTSQRFSQAWIDKEIKQMSRKKKRFYQKAKKSGKVKRLE